MKKARIVSIEWATLEGRRPRAAGCNARLGEHGQTVRAPIARIVTEDGARGFGASTVTVTAASALVGRPVSELWDAERGCTELGRTLDFPLWDLMAKRKGLPAYALAAQMAGMPLPETLRVSCYDTSLYIDDLHLGDDDQAASLIADEAREGFALGHRAFKIKVGRGARHMPLEAGTRRDIAVVRAVRAAVGFGMPLMLDANNGYNLNLAKRMLAETADCEIFWMEEPFHEDRILYADLQEWLTARGIDALIADGEGDASPNLLDWAEQRLIDVIQYDITSYGFTEWLALGRKLDKWGVDTAPHNYGRLYGNFASCHLASTVQGFTFTEWDEAIAPGLDHSGYALDNGQVTVPSSAGFGLSLDEDTFEEAVKRNGYRLTWK